MKKHKHKLFKKDEINQDVAEEVMKEVFQEMQKRRIIIRKPTGEIVIDVPAIASFGVMIVALCFFLPILIFAVLASYYAKLRFDVVTEVRDEEDYIIDAVGKDNTVMGIEYEAEEGQATLIQ